MSAEDRVQVLKQKVSIYEVFLCYCLQKLEANNISIDDAPDDGTTRRGQESSMFCDRVRLHEWWADAKRQLALAAKDREKRAEEERKVKAALGKLTPEQTELLRAHFKAEK